MKLTAWPLAFFLLAVFQAVLPAPCARGSDLLFQTPGNLSESGTRPLADSSPLLGHVGEIVVGSNPVTITRVGFYGQILNPAKIAWVIFRSGQFSAPELRASAVEYAPTPSVQWLESPSFAPFQLQANTTYFIGFISDSELGAVKFHYNGYLQGISTTQNGLSSPTAPYEQGGNPYGTFSSPQLMLNSTVQLGLKIRHGAALISPRSQAFPSNIPVDFYLPTTPASGSLQLIFHDGTNARVLGLASALETAGRNQLTIQADAPTLNPLVASGEPLPDGKYTVQVSYRTAGGETFSDSSNDVIIDHVAPVFSIPGGQIPYTEGEPDVLIAAGATTNELAWNQGSLAVQIESNALSADRVTLSSDARIRIEPTAAYDGDVRFAALASTLVQGNGILRAAFNENATSDRVQALLRALRFGHGSGNPGTGTRTIRITLTDSAALQSSATREVRTIPVNTAPVLSSNGQGATFTEGKNVPSTAVVIASSITIADDSATFSSARLRLAGGFRPAEDLLVFTPTITVGNITGSYNAVTGVLTLTSAGATASLTQWQNALRLARYDNSSQNPTAGPRTVEFILNDGVLESNGLGQTVTVVPVNDSPVANPVAVSTNEDETVAITLSSSDPEGAPLTYTVQSGPAHGTLTGKAPNLVYTPQPNFNGGDFFTFRVNDGSEGSAVATVNILVKSVNDVPTLAPLPNVEILENWGSTILVPFAGVTSGAPNEFQDFTVIALTQHDDLIPSISVYYESPNEGGIIAFKPAPDVNGSATISVTVLEEQTEESVIRSFVVNILPVNSAPSFTKGSDVVMTTGGGPQTISAWATNISAGPPDEINQSVTFAVSADNPSLFTEMPRISPAGTLTFTPAPKASGRATVTVQARDNGGIANRGADSSPLETFQIIITSNAEESGAYVGRVLPETSDKRSHDRAGIIRVDVQSGGTFTGNLRLGGKAYPLKGRFDQAGVAQFGASTSIRLPGTRPALKLSLHLDVADGTGKLTGDIEKSEAALDSSEPPVDFPFARIVADRILYTATPSPRAPYHNVPEALLGRYTVLLENAEPPQGTAQLPEGSGYLLVILDRRGIARSTGRLADGTAVSYANFLTPDNAWPVQILAYKNRGSAVGRLSFDGTSDTNITGSLDWFRPAIPGARKYPQGWPEGIEITAEGEKFALPAPSQPQSIFANLRTTPLGNAALDLVGADFSHQAHRLNIYPGTNRVMSLAVFNRNLRLQINLNGTISGTFTDPITAAVGEIGGAVLQKSGRAAGFILGPREAGAVTITTALAERAGN